MYNPDPKSTKCGKAPYKSSLTDFPPRLDVTKDRIDERAGGTFAFSASYMYDVQFVEIRGLESDTT